MKKRAHHFVRLCFFGMRYPTILIGFLAVLVVFEAYTLLMSLMLREGKVQDISFFANSVIKACQSRGYKPSCYDEEIPKLMESLSMEEAFEVTKGIQEKDPSYQYCHVLGHKLSARETAQDPTKWKEVVSRCPSGLCSNGCIHGAFQERFRTDVLPDASITALKPELEGVCEEKPNWKPTGLEQASCYHALGHLTMYITGANISKSLTLCGELGKKQDGRDYTQLCFDGTFMQIFQPLEPEDFALVEGKQPAKEEAGAFCKKFEGDIQGSCRAESWPLFREEIHTPQGLVAFCSFLKDEVQMARCYSAMFYVITPQLDFDEAKISDFCTELPQGLKRQCFANAASRMIETDYRNALKSKRLCERALASGVGEACFDELIKYSTYNFLPASDAALNLCKNLPSPWQETCLQRNKMFER